jgi:hypothetical protein
MNPTRKNIEAQMEAQRWQAQQAAREQPAQVALNAALERAGELAQQGRLAESRRVIALNYFTEAR